MDFNSVRNILLEWKTKSSQLHLRGENEDLNYRNSLLVATKIKDLANFLRSEEQNLRQWMMKYLAENRKKIFLKSNSSLVLHWAKDKVLEIFPKVKLHPEVAAQWDSVFGTNPAKSFSLVQRVVQDHRSRTENQMQTFKDIASKCDDLTIIARHEGIECQYMDWIGCELCETQCNIWRKELVRRMTHSQHPLLNSEDKLNHITCYWENGKMKPKEVPEDWIPLHHWCHCYSNHCEYSYCYDYDEFIKYMKKNMGVTFAERGLTPVKACSDILFNVTYCARLEPRWDTNFDDEYSVFDLLWNSLDIISASYDYVIARADELTAMVT